MGRDKADVEMGGRTMLEVATATLGTLAPEVLVVGRSQAPPGARPVADLRPGRAGPLAGLEAALTAADGADVALLAVDHPLARPETLVRLTALPGDAVVPFDTVPQVTVAVYRAACLPAARRLLDAGPAGLRHLLAVVATTVVPPPQWQAWGEDGRSWFAVDTPRDAAEARRRLG